MNYYDYKEGGRKRGLFSYFFVGIVGAIVGGMLVLTFAPPALLGKALSQGSGQAESTPQKDASQNDTSNDKPESEDKAVTSPNDAGTYSTTEIVQKLVPAVVGIRTTKFKKSMVFGDRKVEGIGSGVIADRNGYIITNNHVADDQASDITVYLIDGRTVPAATVWTDTDLDLSILKINADNLSVAEIGDSDKIQVGEAAIAIGNPLGLRFERSVTEGIISALNRTLPLDDQKFMEDLIQTDASINEGNSGGPLINSEAKVIGINTIKVSSAEGMGFAVPINIITPVIKSIIKNGKFDTPYLGIISGLDRESASLYDIKLDAGIYIYDIDKKGPAYKAGIRKGDVILEVDSKPVNTFTSLKQIIFNTGAGGTISIRYLDADKNMKTTSATLTASNT
ncbi:MAG: trypsin-like peptidase domain-containing protein [Clostridiales bacterium]|nr:trypsin-like peptidase domain-containing protein [Clostridiales bacterium]